MKENKILTKNNLLLAGLGVLLYYILKPQNKTKTENKPVDVKGNDNEVTKGVKIEVQNPSLIRIDPSFQVSRYFKDGEFFGKKSIEVSREVYENWKELSGQLDRIRGAYKKPVNIVSGYSLNPDGKGAVIKPQDNNYKAFWKVVENLVFSLGGVGLNAQYQIYRMSSGWASVLKSRQSDKQLL